MTSVRIFCTAQNWSLYEIVLDQSVSTSFCPTGWHQYGYACYQLQYAQQDTWDNANMHCGTMWAGDSAWTSTLATIVDEYENAFVSSLLYDQQTSYDIQFGGKLGAHIGYSGTKSTTGQAGNYQTRKILCSYNFIQK